jgi:hypothetical protein
MRVMDLLEQILVTRFVRLIARAGEAIVAPDNGLADHDTCVNIFEASTVVLSRVTQKK